MRIPLKNSFIALKMRAEAIIQAHKLNGKNSIYTDEEIAALQAKLKEGEAHNSLRDKLKRDSKRETFQGQLKIGNGLGAADSDPDSVANQLRTLKKRGESKFNLKLMELVRFGWEVMYGSSKIGIDEEGVGKNAGDGSTSTGAGNAQGQLG